MWPWFISGLGQQGKGENRTMTDRSSSAFLTAARLPQLTDAEVGPEAPCAESQAGPYLRVGRHHELGGQADVGHPAFRGEGHHVGQGVVHLDGGRGALPDGAHHLNGFDDA